MVWVLSGVVGGGWFWGGEGLGLKGWGFGGFSRMPVVMVCGPVVARRGHPTTWGRSRGGGAPLVVVCRGGGGVRGGGGGGPWWSWWWSRVGGPMVVAGWRWSTVVVSWWWFRGGGPVVVVPWWWSRGGGPRR